ncbi:hypothetical protein PR048_028437 [Dryococelus australis]|uniref:Uncharacterized protein n=1 Tax=Dryococelus australis TaxID=614101 RepID=A0ABQ9GBA2_9NEOP|nr:hypothetical protein PR048_028437 [Dryococelus australis]
MGPIMYLETTPDVLTTFAMDASLLQSNNSSSLLEDGDSNYVGKESTSLQEVAMKQDAKVLLYNNTGMGQ